jgi:hypothetical protein
MLSSLCRLLFALMLLAPKLVPAAENPLANAQPGQWAKYLVTCDRPEMSSTDKPRWRIVTDHNRETGFVRLENKIWVGGQQQSGGPAALNSKEAYEPLLGLAKNAVITVVSTESSTLEITGKPIACTKIVRKIDSPLTSSNPSWKGVSTIWISSSVPLGLVRMENEYDQQDSADEKPQHSIDRWVLAEYGTAWVEE